MNNERTEGSQVLTCRHFDHVKHLPGDLHLESCIMMVKQAVVRRPAKKAEKQSKKMEAA